MSNNLTLSDEVTQHLENLDCDLLGYDTVLSGVGYLCYGTFVTAFKNTRCHDPGEKKSLTYANI